MQSSLVHAGQYALVNNLNMYYEVHGSGKPLVLLHGGGSTIKSNFGKILPVLAKTHQVIAIELQAHGHTPDAGRSLSFEQDADDVAGLLMHLNIAKADIMGFSNGGTTCLQIAIRHPQLVNKLILASAAYKREGLQSGFFEGMQQATLDHMPQPLKEAFREINPDPAGLQIMFERDVARMLEFKDIADETIAAIQAPALVINGDNEVITAKHAMELSKLLPYARLAILPCGHGEYIGELCSTIPNSKLPELVIAMIEEFLND